MKIIECPSDHFDERSCARPSLIIIHYTGTKTAQEALNIMTGQDMGTNPSGRVSAHYLIDETGEVYTLVPEDKRAWHAGVSEWYGETDINSHSIGIELQNPGDRPFAQDQIQSLMTLLQQIKMRYDIPPQNVLGHSDVAPGRKQDPGEYFPWQKLIDAGLASR